MKTITKLSAILFAAAIYIAWPGVAQTTPPPSTAPSTNAPARPRAAGYRGVVASVDTANMVLTLKKNRQGVEAKVKITHDTKIKKDGEPAQFSDAVEGLRVSGSGKQGEDGVWTANTLNIMTKQPMPKPSTSGSTPQTPQ
jgi:hypothetical protein